MRVMTKGACTLALLAVVASGRATAQLPSAAIPEVAIVDGSLGRAYAPLLVELQSGELVLLFRHDRTEVTGLWDYEPFKPEDCGRQRRMSEAGRASARTIGQTLRLLQIPIGHVAASSYCRATRSAVEMFGGVHEKTIDLIGSTAEGRTNADIRNEVAR